MKLKPCDINIFKPARNISFLIGLLRKYYMLILKVKYPHLSVEVISGLKELRALQTDRVILCPNHPTSMDTDMAFLLATLLQEELYFLTAREVFIGSFVNKYLLQLFGCYSVLRGTNDFNSFKYSVRLMQAGLHKLVIFPEGEICRRNDILLPLKPGPAHIACTTLDRLRKSGIEEAVHIVPLVFRYSYPDVTTAELKATMTSIEKALSIGSSQSLPLSSRMVLAGEIVLQELLSKYNCPADATETFYQKVKHARAAVLKSIACYINFQLDAKLEEIEQIHRLFVHLYEARWYEHQLSEHFDHAKHTERYGLLTEMIRDLFRISCFISVGKDSPLRDRNDDINDLMLLRHEVLGDRTYSFPVRLEIALGRPINVQKNYSGKKEEKLKSILSITELMQDELENVLAGLIKMEPEITNRAKPAFAK
jgi:1-acyl-sn-glycerol-3-phosphate acyltransferase